MKKILLFILILLFCSCSGNYRSKFKEVLVIEAYTTEGMRDSAHDEYAIHDGRGYLSFDKDPLDPNQKSIGYFVLGEFRVGEVSTFSRTRTDSLMGELRNHFGKFYKKFIKK